MKPIDIEMKEFKRARFSGYNIDDVNEFLDEVIIAFEDMQKEHAVLEDKIISLNESLAYYKTMETTLQNTMVLAEKTSQETQTLANEKAKQIILEANFTADQMMDQARKEVYDVRQNIKDLKKQYESAKIQIKKMFQTQLEILESQDVYTDEFSKITNARDTAEEEYYTKEYQIINEEDVL